MMPYEVRKVDNQYCVYKESGGSSLGCHPTRGEAERQIAAILVSTHKPHAGEQRAADWWVTAKQLGELCETCGESADRMGWSAVNLKAMPPALLNSLCASLGGDPGFYSRCLGHSFGGFDPGDKESFCAWLHQQCTGQWPAEHAGKSLSAEPGLRLGLIVTSNAYQDIQQEIVRQKAWEGYVERAWEGDKFVGSTPLLFWHGGDPIGDIVYADMEGPFLIEVVQERPDRPINLMPAGQPPVDATVKAVWDALEEIDTEWGASPEFLYLKGDEKDGVYDVIAKTESSVLPRRWAANAYTFFGVISRS